ncbi:hypothetical protein [Haladaptatus salinisoli]|uniref:hypothetical protein n=1 Tax=Haladaptatus salinisoli TaxID=2884876 RepID=UPI001D0A5E5C|nr:hypothetical protein [Haladaptatus salinisoli]
MPITTYALVVRENENREGITAEVREDETIEESARISYDDYGLTAEREETSDERRTEFAADVTTLRIQTERDGEGFQFRVLGDGETLVEQRVTDDEWNVTAK